VSDSHGGATKSLYDILEVSASASRETIEVAYRSLISRYHPDKVSGLGADIQELANRRAQELNSAYAVLRDPAQRAAYDQRARTANRPRPAPSPAASQSAAAPHPRPTGNQLENWFKIVWIYAEGWFKLVKPGLQAIVSAIVIFILLLAALNKGPALETLTDKADVISFLRLAVPFAFEMIGLAFWTGLLTCLCGTIIVINMIGLKTRIVLWVVRGLVSLISLVLSIRNLLGLITVSLIAYAGRTLNYQMSILISREVLLFIIPFSLVMTCLIPRPFYRFLQKL
jgi:hypothetical protein